MKNFLLLIAIASLGVFVSCGKDDDPGIINSIAFDGKTFTPESGLIIDYGVTGGSHYNYDFYVSDGALSLTGTELSIGSDATFFVYAALISQGTNGFSTGEFEFSVSSALPEKNVFVIPYISVRGESGFEQILGTGGTLVVSGTSPNYVIQYNLTLQGKTLTGAFTGPFNIEDAPDEE